jgi:hypothetical protein
MISVQKTFKKDSVEVDILDYTPNIDRMVCRKHRIDVPRDKELVNKCAEHVANYMMKYAEDPGFLMVGWKTFIQLELETELDKSYNSRIFRNGLMYVQDAVVVVDPKKDFYIKAMPNVQSSADPRPEREKIIEEFEELVIRAMNYGIGVNQLRKTVSEAMVDKVLSS